MPDGSVKVVIEGKDQLKKVVSQEEISRGFLKLNEEVGGCVPVPFVGLLGRGSDNNKSL